MTKLNDLHAKWMNDSEYRNAYDALEGEFSLEHAELSDDLEDLCIAEKRLLDVKSGKSKIYTLDEVMTKLGLESDH